ncbi:MAG: hypothetical protein M1828_005758 [Chrysothrix sp. TS-e1954]|nr:MAG: hypothetical protein M1828_005758 [Chrysothrix sp. TS-e1954]
MVLANPRADLPVCPLSPSISPHFSTFALAPEYLLPQNHAAVFKPIRTPSREPKQDTEDTFLARTLSTPSTITRWQSFYVPRSSPGRVAPSIHFSEAGRPCGELHILLTLASGMNGKDGIAHGGLVSVLFDELITALANFHREELTSGYTATLKVDYKAPVTTPGSYLLRAWLDERSGGRKAWVKGDIVGVDKDDELIVLAKGEGLVLDVRKSAKL